MRPAYPNADSFMEKSDSSCDFVVDQLGDLGTLHVRRMFGGFGIYHKAAFFAIVHNLRLRLGRQA